MNEITDEHFDLKETLFSPPLGASENSISSIFGISWTILDICVMVLFNKWLTIWITLWPNDENIYSEGLIFPLLYVFNSIQ